jgi:hypothetical protein
MCKDDGTSEIGPDHSVCSGPSTGSEEPVLGKQERPIKDYPRDL